MEYSADTHPLALSSLQSLRKGHLREALELARRGTTLESPTAATLNTLGSVLSACSDHANALQLFRRAVALEPRSPQLLLNLSMEMRFCGLLEEAEHYADLAILRDPSNSEALLHRSGLRRQTHEHNNIRSLEERLAMCRAEHWRHQVQLRYALAKEWEDLGNYAESFQHLRVGASVRRAHSRYDVNTDIAIMEEIKSTYAAVDPKSTRDGHPSAEPIFVVGLPRTGTTLVERILGTHDEVTPAGELSDFGVELTLLVQELTNGDPLDRLAFVRRSREIDFSALGRRYVEATRYVTGATRFFVDKLPVNFLYIGLIRRALPNARIVHVRRNPLDTAYSIYKALFRHAYPFSYDLTDLGNYYVSYRRLMDHWHAVHHGAILDVDYEDIVFDQEGASRRLVEFCGLEWHESIRDFHSNRHACTTASAVQVRERLHERSVGRWRFVAAGLEPFRTVLEREGIAIGNPLSRGSACNMGHLCA